MNEAIILTQAAAEKVFSLICEEENYALKLRVYVTGGGCSGFQYGFAFEEAVQADDTVVTRGVIQKKIINTLAASDADEDGGDEGGENFLVSLLIDPISFQYLSGAEIDYREDVDGAQFIIRNPNAKTTCGCGSSFAT